MTQITIPQNKSVPGAAGQARMERGYCMFNTRLCGAPFNTRPMMIQAIDDQGSIWFFSEAGSPESIDIARDNRVQLIYTYPSASEFLSLYGTAGILEDSCVTQKLQDLLHDTWGNAKWTNSDLTLIRFAPLEGFYWDTACGRMIDSLKTAVRILSDTVTSNREEQPGLSAPHN